MDTTARAIKGDISIGKGLLGLTPPQDVDSSRMSFRKERQILHDFLTCVRPAVVNSDLCSSISLGGALLSKLKVCFPVFSQVVPIGMTRMVIDENHYEDICRLLADALLSHDTNAV